ncbi:hypothetical protein CKO11_11860 [Rhodobacter sp. TJ_12]|uniref:hypothetical protein n=1 Tax=Rhodobacter sp. TJ_12 TaxID=2029399 RepID=UPI001CBF33CA|nr:hypothetical protein [Rhodobacter sp. TJ_12]MBZ4023154.1 hypothetical protein [Rhodobacter sp. TJ_12]
MQALVEQGEDLILPNPDPAVEIVKGYRRFLLGLDIAKAQDRKAYSILLDERVGFRYDGRRVYVRDSTISRFYGKVAGAAKRDGRRHVESNPAMDAGILIGSFDYPLFSQRFSKVKKSNLTSDYRGWTFYSYLKRSAEAFGPKGDRILRQARGFDELMKDRVSLPAFVDAAQVAAMLGHDDPAEFLRRRIELEDNHGFPIPLPHWKRPLKWRADQVALWIKSQGLPKAAMQPVPAHIDPALIATGKVALMAEARKA